MAGNVWDWTSSQYKDYPYDATDGRENLTDYEAHRVLRGGSFDNGPPQVRCAVRLDPQPEYRGDFIGFRVGFAPPSSSGL
jgi:formylglycine-generating enzyme required for sulfatase activity